MENNYLNFLGVLYNTLRQEKYLIEKKMQDYDDGNFRSVKDSRELSFADCENIIERFQHLKKEFESLPMKTITEKNLG